MCFIYIQKMREKQQYFLSEFQRNYEKETCFHSLLRHVATDLYLTSPRNG